MKKGTTKKILMSIIAIIGWFALSLQLYIMLRNAPSLGIRPFASVINYLSFFTILTNLLVAKSLTAALIFPNTAAGKICSNPVNQSAIGLYIVIVGLVYSIALRNVWSPTGLQLLADRLLHDLVPVLYLLFWLFFIPRQVLRWRHVFPWLIFPFCYLIYSLIRGAITGWYPYPFIHADQIGYGKVVINSLFVLLAFLIIGLIMIAYNRRGRR